MDGAAEPVIVGFGEPPALQQPATIAPWALAFVNEQVLVVNGRDGLTGTERLRMFRVPAAGEAPQEVGAATVAMQLSDENPPDAESPYFGVAANSHILYAVGQRGRDGWLGRGILRSGRLAAWVPFKADSNDAKQAGPVVISPRGEIVVGQLGKQADQRDSQLSFRNANDGRALLDLEIGLYDISGLAYGADGQLYATDYAAADPSSGGLFQLIAVIPQRRQQVKAKRLLELERPTSLTAGGEGTLYVTVEGVQAGEDKSGSVLKISL
jgi:hypothetical protein